MHTTGTPANGGTDLSVQNPNIGSNSASGSGSGHDTNPGSNPPPPASTPIEPRLRGREYQKHHNSINNATRKPCTHTTQEIKARLDAMSLELRVKTNYDIRDNNKPRMRKNHIPDRSDSEYESEISITTEDGDRIRVNPSTFAAL